MATLDTLIKPEEVIGFIRSTYQKLSEQYQLSSLFPNDTIRTNKFKVVVDTRTAVPAAMFRAWDTEGYNLGRQGVGYKEQEIAPITVTMPLGEQETLHQRAYDTGDYGDIIDQEFDDLGTLAESIATTFELLRAQVLSDARCKVRFRNGTEATVDYGLRSEHRVTVTTYWSDTSGSNPLADIRTNKAVYRANRKKDPAVAFTTQKVVDYLLLNTAVRQLLATTVGTPSFVSVDQLNLLMRAHGLPQIVVIDELIADYDGTVANAIPENLFILGPAGEIGKTFHGVTPASLGLVGDKVIQSDLAPGIIGQTWKNANRSARWSRWRGHRPPKHRQRRRSVHHEGGSMTNLVLENTVHLDGPKTFLAGTRKDTSPRSLGKHYPATTSGSSKPRTRPAQPVTVPSDLRRRRRRGCAGRERQPP